MTDNYSQEVDLQCKLIHIMLLCYGKEKFASGRFILIKCLEIFFE